MSPQDKSNQRTHVMNSNRSTKMVWLVGVALLVSCFGAGLARAQECAGKFTLPFEARWGQATLPAGGYSFRLDKAQSGGVIQLFQGRMGVGFIQPQGYDVNQTGESSLIVVKTKTGRSVRASCACPRLAWCCTMRRRIPNIPRPRRNARSPTSSP